MKKIRTILLGCLLLGAFSCTTTDLDVPETDVNDNSNLRLQTKAIPTNVMDNMRLHLFNMDDTYKRPISYEYSGSTTEGIFKATVETGTWKMAMISDPSGTTKAPAIGIAADNMPLYVYNPTAATGTNKTASAPEIFATYVDLPYISPNATATLPGVKISRNMALVRVNIVNVVSNVAAPDYTTTNPHLVKLHNVPSTISYGGKLLPSKDNPDVVSEIQAPFSIQRTGTTGNYTYSSKESVEFIIPAHRGSDFWGANTDKSDHKMTLSVKVKRSSGTNSYIERTKEIPLTAHCNEILEINLTINDGMDFDISVLPWEEVSVDVTVGDPIKWVYVKQGANGNGQSWNRACNTITEGLAVADRLIQAGEEVYGILVAGGTPKAYSEANLTLPADIKIFGGWAGVSGTELSVSDPNAPYTSLDRKLKDYKPSINSSTPIALTNANTALDGVSIKGTMLTLNNDNAYINAVEIADNSALSTTHALSIIKGTATNVLVADNNKGISLTGGKLINATVAGNTGASAITGASVYNTVFWKNTTVSITGTNTIQNCAFPVNDGGDVPAGANNIPISPDNNTAWFNLDNVIPGPHFYMTANNMKYAPGQNRSPMLSRGAQTIFDANTPFMTTDESKQDINGNYRHYEWTDIGCFEDPNNKGFRLYWASDRVYISSRLNYESEVPLLIPENEGADKIEVKWTVTVPSANFVVSGKTRGVFEDGAITSKSGTGDEALVGKVKITSKGDGANNDYTGNTEVKLGSMTISTNLGAYLPDETVDIYMTPGKSKVWYMGYVGSFHRNDETSERYIAGPNPDANTNYWSVRIINGLDWIKIDNKPKGYNNGNVIETIGGVVEGQGDIRFRVGMKSTLPEGSLPRYGLIVITRQNREVNPTEQSVAMFFVRQGEHPDYLYGPNDPRSAGTQTGRANGIPFSPYNIVLPNDVTMVDGGVDLNEAGKSYTGKEYSFAQYPTMVGDYFQANATRAYRMDVQQSNLDQNHSIRTASSLTISPCPANYRYGTIQEWVESLYQHVAWNLNAKVDPSKTEASANFIWGHYADGLYDQHMDLIAQYKASSSNYAANTRRIKIGGHYHSKGILMVNHYNLASIFFSTGQIMLVGKPTWTDSDNVSTWVKDYVFYNTSTFWTGDSYKVHNAHWKGTEGDGNGHIGMSCTSTVGSTDSGAPSSGKYVHGVPVRCVYTGTMPTP